jgi:hypothetical protein
MHADEPDLEELTLLLGQCLGRIDEQAYRLQATPDDGDDPEEFGDVLEDEAARLQMLIGSLLESAGPAAGDRANLNRTVQRAIDSTLKEIGFPVVVRQRLDQHLPRVAWQPGQLSYAVQRALLLATSHAGIGGEVQIGTRCEGGSVLLELEAYGSNQSHHLRERAVTLRDFVQECRGTCRIDIDGQGALLLAMDLPAAGTLDER